ncbi:hypothetical protein GCM10023328_24050 [Modestobacter marinus]|uniref:O-antigen/teichoic acid export membrane protein n=1 Tax=Modestobacter marinus TaxID=477641 RepID=A0A846LFE8_9ACTN|nr:oligosaccharide flippase family protein [Modestobacter marinus]NIH66337.1 O-antigen/teichoic acid export membrane protein [Modestobacter marinus]GGL62844.1 hypothetical protein GCM10011589_18830 [Modestobacter marinus]
MSDSSIFRRAVLLSSVTSFLVPLVGLMTAPILAHALGVEGRGEMAAAVAPYSLIVAVATLGLPQALTFYLAKNPELTRRVLLSTTAVTLTLGAGCLAAMAWLVTPLSGGNSELAMLIMLASACALPALVVNLMRGAAAGRQMWGSVASEGVLNSSLRLIGLGGLALAGLLDVRLAVLVTVVGPAIAGIAYWKLLRRPTEAAPSDAVPMSRPNRVLLGYGARTWLGSVASMLTARLSQLLVTPLSDVGQLGLFVVAVTIADVPFLVTAGIRDAVFGVSSQTADPQRLAATSRVVTLAGLLGAGAIAATLPFWIRTVFGEEFGAAIPAALILLAAAVANMPGLIAGVGLGAWGRPGLRSWVLVATLVTNLIALLTLVPVAGAVGAALAGLLSGTVMSVLAVALTARVVGVPVHAFVFPRTADLRLLVAEVRRALGKLRRRRTTRSHS